MRHHVVCRASLASSPGQALCRLQSKPRVVSMLLRKDDLMLLRKDDLMLLHKDDLMLLHKDDPMLLHKDDSMLLRKDDSMLRQGRPCVALVFKVYIF